MIKFDEEALICDLAETYNIYDYRQLPLTKVAVFSCGLRENSRIKMKMSGQQVSLDTLLLANVSDKLGLLVWSKTKDAQKGANQPKSMVEMLTNIKTKETRKELVFDSGEDFERARKAILEGGG